jgi:hypothetical protein
MERTTYIVWERRRSRRQRRGRGRNRRSEDL